MEEGRALRIRDMSAFGVASYGIAALSFLMLTVLLITAWRGRQQGAHLIVASGIDRHVGAILALQSYNGHVAVLVVYVAEAFRGGAWLLTLLAVAGIAAPKPLVIAARSLCVLLLGAAIVLPLLEHFGVAVINPALLLSRAGLALSLLALILLEQIYRNSSQAARGSLKYFIIGVGTLFAYDLFLYSQTELLRAVSVDAWNARGLLNAFAMPLIAIAARRNPEWSLDVFVSRQIVFYTTTVLVIGAYLTVMALGGFYVREIGGAWGNVGQIVFFAGAVVVLVSLMASVPLRRHTRVFISKHFYRNKYDYRIEWLRFISTLVVDRRGGRWPHRSARHGADLHQPGRVAVPARRHRQEISAVRGLADEHRFAGSAGRACRLTTILPHSWRATQWIIDTAGVPRRRRMCTATSSAAVAAGQARSCASCRRCCSSIGWWASWCCTIRRRRSS